MGVIPKRLCEFSGSTTTRCVGGSCDPGLRTAPSDWEPMGAEVRRSVYEMKLRRFDARILGLGTVEFDMGAGAGCEGLLTGDAVMMVG